MNPLLAYSPKTVQNTATTGITGSNLRVGTLD